MDREINMFRSAPAIAFAFSLLSLLPAASVRATPVNDTGVTWCIDANRQRTATCAGTGQDGAFGRDVTNPDAGDGQFGFSFVKVCQSGELAGTGSCPLDPVQGRKANQWGCTLDKVTGLLWEVRVDDPNSFRDMHLRYTNLRPDQSGYGSATDTKGYVDRVNTVGLCSATDWRLPTSRELMGLSNLGRAHPKLSVDPDFLPNTMPGPYWTSTQYIERNADAWYVMAEVGQMFPDGRLGKFFVRLVRATGVGANPRYTPNAAGDEITDNETGLIWRRCTEGQNWNGGTCNGNSISVNWEGAIARAQAAGGGWRLPNAKELATLIDPTQANPAIDPVAFPRTPVSNFWSSTSFASFADYAWAVGFQAGIQTFWHMDIGYRVRLVRDGP